MVGSDEDDILLLEDPQENVYVNIRHTKDFQFVTVNTFSTTSSKVLSYMLGYHLFPGQPVSLSVTDF